MAEALVLLEILPTAVEGCVKAYKFWKHAQNIGTDGHSFYTRLTLQSARIERWKDAWDMPNWTEDKINGNDAYRELRNNAQLAVDYFNLIQDVLDDLSELKDKFPSLKHAVTQSQPAAIARLAEIGRKKYEKATPVQTETSLKERFKWAQSRTRREKALHDLDLLISDLTGFFKPPGDEIRPVEKTVPSETDANDLDGEVDPLLSTLATLRTMVSRTQLMPAVRTIANRKLKRESGRDVENNRSVCQVDGSNFLVEWKIVRHDSGQHELSNRIKNVAKLLQARDKPEELRTMDCVWVSEDLRPTETHYKLGYVLAAGRYYTLRDLLHEQGPTLESQVKYQMALTLARAVLYLHFAKWFHKAIRSDNVLYLANNLSEVDAAWPYLMGFDASRPNNATEMTESPRHSPRFNMYRHPDYQGVPVDEEQSNTPSDGNQEAPNSVRQRFRQEYDVYSLGVVLLEIGLGKTVEDLLKDSPLPGPRNAGDFRQWMVEKKIPETVGFLNQDYADILKACIEARFDTAECSMENSFYTSVVGPLEKLQAEA